MGDPAKAAQVWADALSTSDDARDRLAGALADDVTTVSALGTTTGRDAVLATFGQSPIGALFATAQWSTPEVDGDTATITATFASGAPIKGVTVAVTVNSDDRIARVETSVVAAGPPEPKPIDITDAMATTINNALANGTPFVVTYVDDEGQPHISLRGTVQAFSKDQLAIWVRNPEGGLPHAVERNPRVALFYRDPKTRTTYQFHGRARVDHAQEVRDRVYEQSPEVERNFDPQRRGLAVVVDVDRVEGRDAGGPVLMTR